MSHNRGKSLILRRKRKCSLHKNPKTDRTQRRKEEIFSKLDIAPGAHLLAGH